MPEFSIQSVHDIGKLEGWLIVEAKFDQPTLQLRLVLSHVAVESRVRLVIFPSVAFAFTGNNIQANPALNLRTEDI